MTGVEDCLISDGFDIGCRASGGSVLGAGDKRGLGDAADGRRGLDRLAGCSRLSIELSPLRLLPSFKL